MKTKIAPLSFALAEPSDGTTLVTLTGSLDERGGEPLGALHSKVASTGKIVFACAGLTFVNSTGVGLWRKFTRSLPAGSYAYRECSAYLIDYANLCPGLLDPARIESFFLPLRCEKCGHGAEMLVHTRDVDVARSALKAPTERCRTCGEPMAPEVALATYLEFLDGDR